MKKRFPKFYIKYPEAKPLKGFIYSSFYYPLLIFDKIVFRFRINSFLKISPYKSYKSRVVTGWFQLALSIHFYMQSQTAQHSVHKISPVVARFPNFTILKIFFKEQNLPETRNWHQRHSYEIKKGLGTKKAVFAL